MKKMKTLVSCLLCALMLLAACAKPVAPPTASELLNLGERYLLELDYEQAVAQFLAVIEIEPMNARAYIGAAEAYIALGRTDDAIAVLERGYAATGDAEIEEMLQNLSLTIGAISGELDYTDENGTRIVAKGETDGSGNRIGFWTENHFDSNTGALIFLREGNYIDGELSGDDKCIWIDETTTAKYGTGYGFGVGKYENDMRSGFQLIECFVGIEINAAADSDFIRFEDCVGLDLVYVYKGNMVNEVLEDASGTAYQMWMDNGKIEYIGEFRDDTRNGFGKMWSADWEFSGQFIDGAPSEEKNGKIFQD